MITFEAEILIHFGNGSERLSIKISGLSKEYI